MPSYADLYPVRGESGTSAASGPVQLVVDGNGQVVDLVQGMDVDSSSELVVQAIREKRSSREAGDTGALYTHDASGYVQDLPNTAILLVVDTNWLLSHLALFQQLEQLIPRSTTTPFAPVVFILPTRVLHELDGLKKDAGPVGTLARQSTSFVLDKLNARPDLFRGQRLEETLLSRIEARIVDDDDAILDCCLYYARSKGLQVGLLSDDKVLCAKTSIQGLQYISYTQAYSDPIVLLRNMHPDLPPYIESLRAQAAQASGDSSMAHHSLQRARALPSIGVQYPLAVPHDLLQLISMTVASLLSPTVFGVLIHEIAGDNREIFQYILEKSPVSRQMRQQGAGANDLLDYTRWTASACLRLLDQNWSCFVARASRKISFHGEKDPGAGAAEAFSSPERPQASVSASRWASGSPSASTSSRWASSSSSADQSSSSWSTKKVNPSSTPFDPAKLGALANALDASPQDLTRWSATRWKATLEDLEALLLKTGMLDKEEKEWLNGHFTCWVQNVEYWKAV